MPSRAKWAAILMVAAVVATSWVSSARAHELPSGFRDQVVFAGLEEPTTVRFADDGLVFVAEKTGFIEVYDGLADPMPTQFADLRTEVYDTFDRGLLGLALDPDFPAEPYVYALYTYDHLLGAPAGEVPKWGKPNSSGDGCDEKPSGTGVDACPVSGRLVRLTADAAQGYEKAVTSAGQEDQKVLVEGWCTQFSSHSIGDLQFGPEGALYASGGEGGDANNVDYGALGWPNKNQCGDPPAGLGGTMTPPTAEGGSLRAQDARTPNPLGLSSDPTGVSGAVIRIDPDSGEGWPGNPLEASADPNEKRLIGYGFRNPFRFSIDPASGKLYVGNVGWNNYEEIDRFEPSSQRAYNSGWPCYEGPGPNPNYKSLNLTLCENLYADPAATTLPFFYYHHNAGVTENDDCPRGNGSAVSGNALYRGGKFPAAYEGALYFSDPVRGCIYVMLPGENGEPDPTTTTTFLEGNAGDYPGVDLEVGPEGDLFYVTLFDEAAPGQRGGIHRIYYDPDAPFARLNATPISGPTPLDVTLDAHSSSDPNGEALTFAWDLDEDGMFDDGGGEERTLKLTDGSKNVEVAVRVTDGTARTDVARVTLYPGDHPPTPVIEAPAAGLEWHVAQQIGFEGSAEDAEDGPLPDAKLFWKTRIAHCPHGPSDCHRHPLQTFPSVGSAAFTTPDHDYPSGIELVLTAVDSRGLTATVVRELKAHPVDVQLGSDPPGLTLGAGVRTDATPFTLQAIEDGNVTLAAPLTQQLGGRTYSFQRWSDGGSRVHSVTAGAASGYTAFYSAPAGPPPSPPSSEPPQDSAPQTRLLKRPPKVSRSGAARFEFASDPAGARFECKLGAAPYKTCRSPRTLRNLQPGAYALRIRAVNAAGAVDATPVLVKWKVLKVEPSGSEGRKQSRG